MKKFVALTIPVFALTTIVVAGLVEVAVRASWDPARGEPGFLVSDPVRLEKLAPGYDGWFAGVPVRTNRLAFRDSREYDLQKAKNTFRILVLGDSVTFGHGSVYEHTYPYLLEQHLKGWKADVDWQVWNLGVPGYNTSQELAYLDAVGASYNPDLVIVGFYSNDVVDNREPETPTRWALAASGMKSMVKRHLYSFDFYKRIALTIRYRLHTSAAEKVLLEQLAAQDQLLAKPSQVAELREQALTNPEPMSAAEAANATCSSPVPDLLPKLLETPALDSWQRAVRRFQELNRAGTYRVVFFINDAPGACSREDVFDTLPTRRMDGYFLKVMSDGTPAVSSYDAFTRYRPSQMPDAAAHSIGNSNALKAVVLFEFLRARVLTPGMYGSAAH